MYTELVMIVLGISLILYTILGGADFGAGILELFIGNKANSTITKAIAPVWEANHMWLIIAVVILFNGFPKAYIILSTNLHIPVLLMLFAIILRGTAFTFRHYDAIKDQSEIVYSVIFRYSSLLAVFFIGVTISAFFGGTIPDGTSISFASSYVYPWFNWFSFSVGIFLVTLSAYIAGIFLLGEVQTDEGYLMIKNIIVKVFVLSMLAGLGIFLSSYYLGLQFHEQFFNHPISIIAAVLATLLIPFIFYLIHQRNTWILRITTGAQILVIMMGWFIIQWPNLIVFSNGNVLSMYEASSPAITMKILFFALATGVVIIFPSLYYLFRIFKIEKQN